MNTGVSTTPCGICKRPTRALDVVSVFSSSNTSRPATYSHGRLLASRLHPQRSPAGGDQSAAGGDHRGDFRVVMVRVVMEQEEFFDLGLQRQRHHLVKATVAPAHMALVFLAIVLCVHDQHIGSMNQ